MSDDPELSALEECEAPLTIGDVTAFCTKLKGHDRSHSDDEGHSWVTLEATEWVTLDITMEDWLPKSRHAQ